MMTTRVQRDDSRRGGGRRGGGRRGGGVKLAILALALAVGAIGAALIAGFGTGHGWWSFASGLGALSYLLFVGLTGVLLGVFARFRRREGHMLSAIAIVVGLAFSAYLLSLYRTATSVPAIHDITTNLDDPPQFLALKLREDNLAKIPDLGRPGWKALPPLERWKAIHSESYGDLKPLRLAVRPADAIARAEALARDFGWVIASADREAGQLEATATTRFFRFKDDVIVRARPDRGGSLVDLRSVSRVGTSDLGVNAGRLRRFRKALAELD